MNALPQPLSSAPAGSRILSWLPGAYFWDAWAVQAAVPELSALDQFLRAARATPQWVDACMSLRNRVVRRLGLKDLGELASLRPDQPASAYQPGGRVGIFTLFENHPQEALLGDKDKHLDVMISVHKAVEPVTGRCMVTTTTVVHVHNWLGRLYMLPVTPMHRIIVPAVLKKVGRAG